MEKHYSSGSDRGGCMSAGFAKRILSKTSLKSVSSSSKSADAARADEISKLRLEISRLKQTVENYNIALDDKDATIGNLAREKEKLYLELKKVQRTNRNIHQQLEDERDFYLKEKDHYCQEISSIKRSLRHDEQTTLEALKIVELEKEINILHDSIMAKDKIIYNLCVKYLRIKTNKAHLKLKIEKVTTQHEQAYGYIISLLDANQKELDKLISEKMQVNSFSNKRYLNLVKRNARLHYENTQLKIVLVALSKDPNLYEHKKGDSKPLAKTRISISDGKVPEIIREANRVKIKKSMYTHSHEITNAPRRMNPRIIMKRKGNTNKPVEIDYSLFTSKAVQRPSSDPG